MSLSTALVYTTVTHDGAVLSSHFYAYYCTLFLDSLLLSLPSHYFLLSWGTAFWSAFGVRGSLGTSTAIPGFSGCFDIPHDLQRQHARFMLLLGRLSLLAHCVCLYYDITTAEAAFVLIGRPGGTLEP